MIKKLIYILILFIIPSNFAFSETQNAYLEYDGQPYYFKPGDDSLFLKKANDNIGLSETALVESEKKIYLQEALRYYFLLSHAKPNSPDAHLGLGRVYDKMKLDSYAKAHFFDAINFAPNSGRIHFYYGNFYYDRCDFVTALYYYKFAHQHDYSNDYDTNYKMGVIYEKLADIESAKKYYNNALKIRPLNNTELGDKIRLLDELNYDKSQYYLFDGSGKRKKRDK